jgi:hypothetical protein
LRAVYPTRGSHTIERYQDFLMNALREVHRRSRGWLREGFWQGVRRDLWACLSAFRCDPGNHTLGAKLLFINIKLWVFSTSSENTPNGGEYLLGVKLRIKLMASSEADGSVKPIYKPISGELKRPSLSQLYYKQDS